MTIIFGNSGQKSMNPKTHSHPEWKAFCNRIGLSADVIMKVCGYASTRSVNVTFMPSKPLNKLARLALYVDKQNQREITALKARIAELEAELGA